MIGWFEQAYTERLRHEACRTSHDMIYPSWGPGVVMPFKACAGGGWSGRLDVTSHSSFDINRRSRTELHSATIPHKPRRYSTGILYILFLFGRNTARCGGGRTRIAFAGRRTSERVEADGREEATRRDAMIAMATGFPPCPCLRLPPLSLFLGTDLHHTSYPIQVPTSSSQRWCDAKTRLPLPPITTTTFPIFPFSPCLPPLPASRRLCSSLPLVM